MSNGSSLETNILLISISSILTTFYFCKDHFLIFLSSKFTFFSLIVICSEKKKQKKGFMTILVYADWLNIITIGLRLTLFEFLKSGGLIKRVSKCTKMT